jgi:hypothetical protein
VPFLVAHEVLAAARQVRRGHRTGGSWRLALLGRTALR